LRSVFANTILFLLLLALKVRNSFLHPLRRGGALQEVIEEFLQPPRVVLLVDPFSKPVLLAVVAEHVRLFAEATEREEILDPLVPRDRIVFIVVNHQQRRLNSVRSEDWRVVEKT